MSFAKTDEQKDKAYSELCAFSSSRDDKKTKLEFELNKKVSDAEARLAAAEAEAEVIVADDDDDDDNASTKSSLSSLSSWPAGGSVSTSKQTPSRVPGARAPSPAPGARAPSPAQTASSTSKETPSRAPGARAPSPAASAAKPKSAPVNSVDLSFCYVCIKTGSTHRCELCGRHNHVAPFSYEVGGGLTRVGEEGAGQRVNCPVDKQGCCLLRAPSPAPAPQREGNPPPAPTIDAKNRKITSTSNSAFEYQK
jgi:hypothetical protein